eukprot:CAMPEP_0172369300 /NCGR_PEP_ID=MMETSP1060-20121228/31985_1 /TAXON_ID=37318 /ORGANISM="Pseudo-nitzschia pungens, Strain cf. cingulata" /LENGTH=296 /DNA_ID=CAMNT_0013094177 /DNA_START=285 /DNA_END=1175 /DNA_ORIENTATION=-
MNRRIQLERSRQHNVADRRMRGGIHHQRNPSTRGSGQGEAIHKIPRDCATSNYKRAIHDALTWRHLQDVYIETVDHKDYSQRRETHPSYTGFAVEVVVENEGHRGRSVYAAEPIRKGTKVWHSNHLVPFKTPRDLQSFLSKLDHDLQCDALLWAYIEKGEGYVSLALDPGSYINHGETENVINLDEDCYALRDIQMGEELLENYTEFIGFGEEEGVEWYNQIRGWAWQEGELGSHEAESTDEYNLLGAPKVWDSAAINAESGLFTIMPIIGLLLFCAFVLNKMFPYHFYRKEKEGL